VLHTIFTPYVNQTRKVAFDTAKKSLRDGLNYTDERLIGVKNDLNLIEPQTVSVVENMSEVKTLFLAGAFQVSAIMCETEQGA
jgi:hypothetical protein